MTAVTTRLKAALIAMALPVSAVALWAALSAGSTSIFFPSLARIVTTFADTWIGDAFVRDAIPSIRNLAVAYTLGVAVAIVAGTVLGLQRTLRSMAYPVVNFLRSLPSPVLLPMAIMLFGIGSRMSIALITFGVIWPVLLNTIDGVTGVAPERLAVAKVYRLSAWERLRSIILPSAGPQIVAGMRVSLQIGLVLMIISELVGSTEGIGRAIREAESRFQYVEIWAATLLLGLLGFFFGYLFDRFSKRVLRWQQTTDP